jgi:pilus assembly protein CpaB
MRSYINIAIALVLGIALTGLIIKWLGIGAPSNSGPQVVVATSVIEPGTLISPNQLSVITWTDKSPPPDSFSDLNKVVNRIVRQKIYAGEAILEGKLAQIGSKAGLEGMIAVGKRAITVRVNDIVGVAGFALPGSYVDILANIKDNAGQPYSKVVLSRVKVLATEQDTSADPSKPKIVNAVTLELTPEEAELLDLSRTVGSLSLVLRNELDSGLNDSKGARVNDLINAKSNPPPSSTEDKVNPVTAKKVYPSQKSSDKIETIRGLNRGDFAPQQ